MTRVMICEDDPILAMDLERMVEEAGGDVCGVFARASDALDAAIELRPDLAVIDLTLADGSKGGDIAAALAGIGCKLVIVSGGDRSAANLFSLQHTFISKPVPAFVLADIIRACPAN